MAVIKALICIKKAICLISSLYRDALPYGLFMLVYEYTLERLREPDSSVGSSDMNFRPRNINPTHTAIAGALAGMSVTKHTGSVNAISYTVIGMASWVPAVPFDVVKTRMMTESDPKRFRSVWHCLRVVNRVSLFRRWFIAYV